MDRVREIAERFKGTRRQQRGMYSAWCPVCEADTVMISDGGFGVVRISCPNCDEDQILSALDMSREDLIGAGAGGKHGRNGVQGTKDPLPLAPIMPDGMAFPATSLDRYIDALQARTQAPRGLCAQSILAAANLSVQHLADIAIPGIGGEAARRPISNFYVTVARASERKSSTDRISLEGVEAWRKQLEQKHAEEMERYEADMKVRDQIRARGTGDPEGPEPEKPQSPVLLVKDPTQEGLFRSLKSGQLSQGLFNDEAGSFLGGHGMSKDNKMRTCASLNSLWDGSALDRPRAKEHETLRGRRLSLHLMIQPHASEALIGDAMLRDLGFTSRCLTAEPESTISQRPFREVDPATVEACDDFATRVWRHLSTPARTDEHGLALRVLPLSEIARFYWIQFYDATERALAAKFRSIQGFAGKAPEHALRLAAMLTLFKNPKAMEITEDYMLMGIELMGYYLSQQLRMEVGRPSEREEAAQLLLDWMRDKEMETISTTDVCRSGPSRLRKKDAALDAIEMCVESGWMVDTGKGKVNGVNRRQTYTLVTPEDESEGISA